MLGHDTRPSEAAVRAELKARIQLALDSLEPLDREVLALRHFEELGNAEAAQVLGISPEAASKRHLRALKRLKDVFAASPFVLYSEIKGKHVDCRGEKCGSSDDIVVECPSGRAAFKQRFDRGGRGVALGKHELVAGLQPLIHVSDLIPKNRFVQRRWWQAYDLVGD